MRSALALCLLLAACGGAPADEEDAVYLDAAWSFGKDQGALDAAPLPDGPIGSDVPSIVDVPSPDDAGTPDDTPHSDFGAEGPPADTNFDTGPCGGCPEDSPNCVSGVCKCTPFSCTDGTYCKGGECVPCTVDAHCGPDCLSCPSMGQFCVAAGTHCADCNDGHPCPDSQSCIDEVCTPCEALGLCGADCLTCPAETPDCAGGACVCNAGSCPAGSVCEGGACVGCTASDPAHCGPDCLVCAGGAPHCLDGGCTLCDTAAACGPSCQPCAGPAAVCAPGGTGCVECLVDGDCSAGEHCSDAQTCVPNCAAQGCVTDGSPDADKCSKARIAGRLDAAGGGVTFTGDTEDESNDDDLAQGWFPPSKCNDEGEDHFYRIWLRPGETLSVQLDVQDNYFDAMLKLYEGTECDEDDAGIFDDNDAYLVDCWNGDGEGDDESFVWTADAEGWYTVVVDGREQYDGDMWPDDGDYGAYAITLILTCTDANCCCD